MALVASGFGDLSRMVDGATAAAVVLDEFGDVVLYSEAAKALAGARWVDPTRIDAAETAVVLLALPDRTQPIELVATMTPIENPLGRVVGVLGVFRPSAARAEKTLRRAADLFRVAASFEPDTTVVLFDAERRVVLATDRLEPQLEGLCDRALNGEVCRVESCEDCATSMRSGPIRDSLGFIVGGLVVSYSMGGALRESQI